MLLLYYVSWQHLLYIACIVVITGFYNIQCNTAELILLGSPRKSIYRVAQKMHTWIDSQQNNACTVHSTYCAFLHYLVEIILSIFCAVSRWNLLMNYVGKQLNMSITQDCTDQFTSNVQICPRSWTTRSCRRRHSFIARFINEALGQFAPLRDNCILQLLDWGESSTTINHLLDGTPNSVVDWI